MTISSTDGTTAIETLPNTTLSSKLLNFVVRVSGFQFGTSTLRVTETGSP